jgi:pimeloyl-ACP methyl ester carboxylesterase
MRGALLLALGLALAGCTSAYVDPLPKEAIKHRAKTADGWEISLVQYQAVGAARGRPVLLCHGISANERNMDLDADHSLARWFAAHGREAWTMSLRGTGASDRSDEEKGRKPGYDFDTFWREDLAASIAYVRAQSGAEAIDYVGHSMGGMIVYAYLSQGGQGLNAVVTLGSPTRLDWGATSAPYMDGFARLAVSPDRLIPVVSPGAFSLPLQGEIEDGPFQLMLYNPKNTDKGTWKRLIAIGIADISGALALQMLGFIRTGGFTSADGKIDYRKEMGKVRTPVMVVAGKLDRIAIPPAVKDGYRALGGEKEWLLLAEENGVVADYGHMDMVVGNRASTELWPRVLGFLDRHR